MPQGAKITETSLQMIEQPVEESVATTRMSLNLKQTDPKCLFQRPCGQPAAMER
jgi:hypothetical protein